MQRQDEIDSNQPNLPQSDVGGVPQAGRLPLEGEIKGTSA